MTIAEYTRVMALLAQAIENVNTVVQMLTPDLVAECSRVAAKSQFNGADWDKIQATAEELTRANLPKVT